MWNKLRQLFIISYVSARVAAVQSPSKMRSHPSAATSFAEPHLHSAHGSTLQARQVFVDSVGHISPADIDADGMAMPGGLHSAAAKHEAVDSAGHISSADIDAHGKAIVGGSHSAAARHQATKLPAADRDNEEHPHELSLGQKDTSLHQEDPVVSAAPALATPSTAAAGDPAAPAVTGVVAAGVAASPSASPATAGVAAAPPVASPPLSAPVAAVPLATAPSVPVAPVPAAPVPAAPVPVAAAVPVTPALVAPAVATVPEAPVKIAPAVPVAGATVAPIAGATVAPTALAPANGSSPAASAVAVAPEVEGSGLWAILVNLLIVLIVVLVGILCFRWFSKPSLRTRLALLAETEKVAQSSPRPSRGRKPSIQATDSSDTDDDALLKKRDSNASVANKGHCDASPATTSTNSYRERRKSQVAKPMSMEAMKTSGSVEPVSNSKGPLRSSVQPAVSTTNGEDDAAVS